MLIDLSSSQCWTISLAALCLTNPIPYFTPPRPARSRVYPVEFGKAMAMSYKIANKEVCQERDSLVLTFRGWCLPLNITKLFHLILRLMRYSSNPIATPLQ